MDIKTHLKHSKCVIDKALDKYMPGASAVPQVIHKAMRYSVFSGGKRIRPILVLEACKACAMPADRKALKDALKMACAVEMVHAYSLIHDDLPAMDNDDYRRGKPTCHKVFGEANAILAGDALLTLAFNLLSSGLDPDTGIKAVRELSEAIGTFGMVGGQVIDMEHKGAAVNDAVKKRINSLKTARLFKASTRLGAIAARSSQSRIKAMSVFGEAIGDAFQIVDDIMDNDSSSGDAAAKDGLNNAANVTLKAQAALRQFGSRAAILKGIADLMLIRSV